MYYMGLTIFDLKFDYNQINCTFFKWEYTSFLFSEVGIRFRKLSFVGRIRIYFYPCHPKIAGKIGVFRERLGLFDDFDTYVIDVDTFSDIEFGIISDFNA